MQWSIIAYLSSPPISPQCTGDTLTPPLWSVREAVVTRLRLWELVAERTYLSEIEVEIEEEEFSSLEEWVREEDVKAIDAEEADLVPLPTKSHSLSQDFPLSF